MSTKLLWTIPILFLACSKESDTPGSSNNTNCYIKTVYDTLGGGNSQYAFFYDKDKMTQRNSEIGTDAIMKYNGDQLSSFNGLAVVYSNGRISSVGGNLFYHYNSSGQVTKTVSNQIELGNPVIHENIYTWQNDDIVEVVVKENGIVEEQLSIAHGNDLVPAWPTKYPVLAYALPSFLVYNNDNGFQDVLYLSKHNTLRILSSSSTSHWEMNFSYTFYPNGKIKTMKVDKTFQSSKPAMLSFSYTCD